MGFQNRGCGIYIPYPLTRPARFSATPSPGVGCSQAPRSIEKDTPAALGSFIGSSQPTPCALCPCMVELVAIQTLPRHYDEQTPENPPFLHLNAIKYLFCCVRSLYGLNPAIITAAKQDPHIWRGIFLAGWC